MPDAQDLLTDLLAEIIKPLVIDAVREAMDYRTEKDRLLDVEEAAELLSVSPEWLYRNSKKLPFTRKLGHKLLRFSSQGIQKYLIARKAS